MHLDSSVWRKHKSLITSPLKTVPQSKQAIVGCLYKMAQGSSTVQATGIGYFDTTDNLSISISFIADRDAQLSHLLTLTKAQVVAITSVLWWCLSFKPEERN